SSTDNRAVPAPTSASATAEPAPPAPKSTTSVRSAVGSSLAKAEKKPERSVLKPTRRPSATNTVLHAPRRRAAGSTSSSVSTTTCLHGRSEERRVGQTCALPISHRTPRTQHRRHQKALHQSDPRWVVLWQKPRRSLNDPC